jgi:phosphoadenosine phosphosulfate reductase
MREIGKLVEHDLKLQDLSTEERIVWTWETLGPRVSFGTAFGPTGLVLLDIVQKTVPELPVFTIDTGYLFEETQNVKSDVESKYGIVIERLVPDLSIEEQEHLHGKDLYSSDPDACCGIRKVAPLRRKLAALDGWVSSIRRDQSCTRKDIRIVDGYWFDDGHQVVKVNPMADWTKKQVWDYILASNIPYNPLLDQGFPSIGCWPCTQAVGNGGDERDGRWAGLQKTECGIHTQLLSVERPETAGIKESKTS